VANLLNSVDHDGEGNRRRCGRCAPVNGLEDRWSWAQAHGT